MKNLSKGMKHIAFLLMAAVFMVSTASVIAQEETTPATKDTSLKPIVTTTEPSLSGDETSNKDEETVSPSKNEQSELETQTQPQQKEKSMEILEKRQPSAITIPPNNSIANPTITGTDSWTQLEYTVSTGWTPTEDILISNLAWFDNSGYTLSSDTFEIPVERKIGNVILSYEYLFSYTVPDSYTCTGDNGVEIYLATKDPFTDAETTQLLTKYDISTDDITAGFTTAYSTHTIPDYKNKELYLHIRSLNDDGSCYMQFLLESIYLGYNPATPLFRFWSDEKQGHFYTISEEEKNYVIDSYDDYIWNYEGIAYYAFNISEEPNTTPVYRFWSDQKQGHFYTISEEEKNHVIDTYDDSIWRYEGIGYYVYPLSYTGTASTVYRFWSNEKQHHFYTASAEERDYVIDTYDDNVWMYEGEAWKVLN